MDTAQQEQVWLDQVESLFFRFGIKSITMDDVAAELGISKKTLYQLVESKDDLVLKVMANYVSREKTQCVSFSAQAPNAIEEILLVVDCNAQEMSQMKTNIVNDLQKYHREAWNMLQKYHHDFVFKIIRDNIIRGRNEGLYREDFDMDIISKLHLAGGFSLFDEQIFPNAYSTRDKLFKEFMMHYLYGIVSPKGQTYLKKKLS